MRQPVTVSHYVVEGHTFLPVEEVVLSGGFGLHNFSLYHQDGTFYLGGAEIRTDPEDVAFLSLYIGQPPRPPQNPLNISIYMTDGSAAHRVGQDDEREPGIRFDRTPPMPPCKPAKPEQDDVRNALAESAVFIELLTHGSYCSKATQLRAKEHLADINTLLYGGGA